LMHGSESKDKIKPILKMNLSQVILIEFEVMQTDLNRRSAMIA
jgi:hypothetical protein